MTVLVNGVEHEEISVHDRGFAYGDGIFRTLRVERGIARCWDWHFRKLHDDCGAIGIVCPDRSRLDEEIAELAGRLPDSIVKIIVTRGSGERGYAAPAKPNPSRILLGLPLPVYPKHNYDFGISVRICSLRLGFQPRLAGVKHLNRLENVLARAEWNDSEIAEGLLQDTEGNVVGATMSNLLMIEQGALVTPDLTRCGVAGVQRARSLRAAQRHGMQVRVESISLDRVLRADELVLVNSGFGAWQVRQIDGARWGAGVHIHNIRRWLNEED